jgi:hypothetical protein
VLVFREALVVTVDVIVLVLLNLIDVRELLTTVEPLIFIVSGLAVVVTDDISCVLVFKVKFSGRLYVCVEEVVAVAKMFIAGKDVAMLLGF